MEPQKSDRKPRNYYVDYTKRHNKFGNKKYGSATAGSNNARFKETPDIGFGNKGFLITSVDEVKSYLEMRNILESYFEELYKDRQQVADDKKDLSTEDELESELKQLRIARPFKQVKTHCRNSIFINIVSHFSYVDPVVIVDRFFDELIERCQVRTSNSFKVLPIIDTFRNNLSSAKESIANIFANSFKDEGPKKYFIEFQTRGNYKLNPDDKQKMIEGVADTVSELRPEWSVSRENADYIISLISLKNVCCLAILKDYFKRSKYNVMELSKDFVQNETFQEATEGKGDDEENI